MAVQIARSLRGAPRSVAAASGLDRLEVEARIPLDADADEAPRVEFDRGVDSVLDFLWGEPATRIIAAATQNRGSGTGEPSVRYVQRGTVAGDDISLRGDAFRGSGLELMGSGIGSVAIRELLAGARELLMETNKAGLDAPVPTLPLAAVGEAWAGSSEVRYVLCPAVAAK